MSTRKVVGTIFLVAAITVAIFAGVNAHQRAVAAHHRHQQMLVDIAGRIANYWEERFHHSHPIPVCELEQESGALLMIKDMIAEAKEFGEPIDPTLFPSVDKTVISGEGIRSVDTAFAAALIKAFRTNAGIPCGLGLGQLYGRNSYTLLILQDTIRESNISPVDVGLDRQGVRPLAIELLKGWVADRKAGKDPHADNSVKYIAKAFGISNLEVGCQTDQETRKYFLELPE
jgi:hypothetical protein